MKKVYLNDDPNILLYQVPRTELKGDGFAEVSDIIDALMRGGFQKGYNTWGHGVKYYAQSGRIEKETFANLFAIRHDKKAYALAREIIPNTVKEFEKRLEILEKL